MNRVYLRLLCVAGLLAGCANMQEVVKEDRAAAIERCERSVKLSGPAAKSQFKLLTGASDEKMPSVVCNRLVRGIESGRITWSDINKMQIGQGTQIFKVLKGQ